MKTRNLAVSVAAVAAAGAAAWWALQPAPIPVSTAPLNRGAFEQVVADDGKTRVRDRYVVSAPLAGRLERVRLKPGDPVERGQEVARLLPAAAPFLDERTTRELNERVGAAEAQRLRAGAELRRQEAQRDQARTDHERQVRLAREGFVSASAVEQAALALRTAERAVEGGRFAADAAAHELSQARAAVSRQGARSPAAPFAIASPVRGVVLKVAQESEAVVATGAAILEIADAASLEAVVDVLSEESVKVRPGMAARVEVSPGAPPLAATVRRVEPAGFTKVSALGIEEQRVNVVLDFADPPAALASVGDGYRVEARIVVHREEGALTVPVGALFREADGWAVFVVEGNKAVKREVTIPRRNATEALVTAGVAPGDTIVMYPPDTLAHGARVDNRGWFAAAR